MPPENREPPFVQQQERSLEVDVAEAACEADLCVAPSGMAAFFIMIAPFLVIALYVFLRLFDVFSALYPWLHFSAAFVMVVWIFKVSHGAPRGRPWLLTLGLTALVALLVGIGSCWPVYHTESAQLEIEAPAYTRLAPWQMNPPQALVGWRPGADVPKVLTGSAIKLNWLEDSSLPSLNVIGRGLVFDVNETQETRVFVIPEVRTPQRFDVVVHRGLQRLALWRLVAVPDEAPRIVMTSEPEITLRKTVRFSYKASDDYGLERVDVRIAPTTSAPDVSMEPVEILLATPYVRDIEESRTLDLTSLPWAGIPVSVQLIATDGAGNRAWSESRVLTLPARSFSNPFSRALIEERQRLLKPVEPSVRDEAANVMAGIARQQGLYRGDPVVMMSLRAAAVRLVLSNDPETLRVVSDMMWQAALRLEEGALGRARTNLAQTQQDLATALSYLHPSKAMEDVYLARLQKALAHYFEVLEHERTRQPTALQDMDLPFAGSPSFLAPQALLGPVEKLAAALSQGQRAQARKILEQLQTVTENLQTAPPELTPLQAQMAAQVSALRLLIRGQKTLLADVEKLMKDTAMTPKAKHEVLLRARTQQQLLLSTLEDVVARPVLEKIEVGEGRQAMALALADLEKGDLKQALRHQTQAFSALERQLAQFLERIRSAMATKVP
ncbi:MAG: DUF4175 domain-containing protein [Alphaproteobacteria bacterium]|nr:DUF4175 domain-containing protein [Alphaproteobacteria bacterium]